MNPNEVPVGYFEGLTDKIMDRVDMEQSILFSHPVLRELPYKTPSNYFEELTDQIERKTETSEVKVIPLWSQNWFKYAASFILILGAVFVLNQSINQEPETDLINQLTESEIIEYLSTEETGLDELLTQEEVMELVLDDMMADVAYNYSDLIDYEVDDLYFEQ